jgi:hypothetical protein
MSISLKTSSFTLQLRVAHSASLDPHLFLFIVKKSFRSKVQQTPPAVNDENLETNPPGTDLAELGIPVGKTYLIRHKPLYIRVGVEPKFAFNHRMKSGWSHSSNATRITSFRFGLGQLPIA